MIPALLFPCEGGKAPNFGRRCFPGEGNFPDTAWLRTEIKAGRVKALGEITAQYLGMAPNDPSLEPYFAIAEELNVPVLIHLGFGPPAAAYPSSPVPLKSPNFRAAAGSPFFLEDVLLRHKRMRVFVMHAGWPLIDEMIAILYYHPQVYVDLAGLQSLLPRAAYDGVLRKLVDAGFVDRIMLGSDATESGLDWLRDGIGAIREASFLSSEQRRAILYDNAARFFQLDSTSVRR
jgi:predicted TIM-barrel fold metal-dependent hydrolase